MNKKVLSVIVLAGVIVLGLYIFWPTEKVEFDIPESVNTKVETQEEFSPCENCKG